MTSPITRDDLASMFPRALPEWLDALYELGPELARHYGWNRLDWVHFMGQIAAETNGLSLARMRENMSFSTASRILEVYSYRLGKALQREPELRAKYGTREALAKSLVRDPVRLANIVYGGREGTPWMQGSRFIGRGPTQITHLNNYRAVGEEITRQPGGSTLDLVGNPELLETDPELGIRSAFADWEIKGLSRYAQKDDCDTLSDALNTGNIRDNVKPHGLPRRRHETDRAKKIWRKHFTFEGASPAPTPTPAPAPLPAPVTIDDITKVSRKARLISRLINAVRAFIAGISAASLLEFFGFAKEVFNEIKVFVADHAYAVGLLVAVLLLVALGKVLRWLQQDVEEGRYVPSGAVGAAPSASGEGLEQDRPPAAPAEA